MTNPVPHKVLFCPECGGKLKWDNHPCISEQGTAYRRKECLQCGVIVHTKQGAEMVTGVEQSTQRARGMIADVI